MADETKGIPGGSGEGLKERPHRRYNEDESARRRKKGIALGILALITALIYIGWLFTVADWRFWYMVAPFLVVELVGLALHLLHYFNTWFLRHHRPEGLPIDREFSIDVFVAVCGEPIEVVKPTIEAATRIDYANKRVFLLDDRSDSKYRLLADRLGVGYLARPTHADAKGGNLNYALEKTDGDLILTLDADQVPQPDILTRMVGYFKLPWIGFVQSVQSFKVPKGDPFGNKDDLFYKVYQSARDYENSAISCGSGVVYRRKALEEIGGFSTWNIVEDVHTSFRLHRKGWKSVYHNLALTEGTAPADILGNYRQRYQWATDSIRILFWDCPFGKDDLNLRQKIMYSNFGLYYIFMGFFIPFFFFVPIWSVFTGNFVITAPPLMYLIYRLPYFVAQLIAGKYTSKPASYVKSFQVQMGYFPVYIASTIAALWYRKSKPGYKVTAKKSKAVHEGKKLIATLPQFGLIIASEISIIYAVVSGHLEFWLTVVNVFWLAWTIFSLSPVMMAAFGRTVWEDEAEPVHEAAGSGK